MNQRKQFRKRNAILTCLRQTDSHPSAKWVFEQLKPEYPDLSLDTVYRNLALFKEEGLIVSLGSVQGMERFDGNTAPHAHFVCGCCGAIRDLHGLQVPWELCSEAEQITGGKISACCLSFSGTCPDCLARKKAM